MIEMESVSVFRGDTDRKGNVVKGPVGSVDVVFGWGTSSSPSRDRQESASLTAQLYTARCADLRSRDRIERSNGERYAVIGHPVWLGPNELEVFGHSWMVFEVEAING